MSDWPRCMSPAVNTARYAGHPSLVAPHVAAIGQLHAEIGEQPLPLRADRNPIASNTRSTSISNSLAGTGSNDILPSLRTSSTFEPWSFVTRPDRRP